MSSRLLFIYFPSSRGRDETAGKRRRETDTNPPHETDKGRTPEKERGGRRREGTRGSVSQRGIKKQVEEKGRWSTLTARGG